MRRNSRNDNLKEPLHTSGEGAAFRLDGSREDFAADIPGQRAQGDSKGKSEDVHHTDGNDAVYCDAACMRWRLFWRRHLANSKGKNDHGQPADG